MKKIFYQFAIFICVAIVSSIVFYGCKHENISLNNNDVESSSISSIKKEFTLLRYDDLLTTKINDTASLYLEPKWEYFTTKSVGDSITYTYILLRPTIKSKGKTKSPKQIAVDYIRQYLLVREQKNKKTGFSIARYVLDEKVANVLKTKNANSLSSTALTTSFTGQLLIKDLSSKANKAYSFNNGIVQSEPAKSKVVMGTKGVNEVCVYEYYCEFLSTCDNKMSYTTTLNANSCACPTYTFSFCTTGSGACAAKGWGKVNETIFVRNCNDGTNPDNPSTDFPIIVNPTTPPPIFPPNGLVCVRLDRENLQTYTDNVDPATQSHRDQEYADITMRFFSDVTCTIPTAANPTYSLTYEQYISSVYWGGANIFTYYTTVHNSSATSNSIYLGYLPTYSYNTFYDQSQGQIIETNDYDYSIVSSGLFNIIDN